MKMTGGFPAVGHCGLLSRSREETKIPAKPAICHWHSLTTGSTAWEREESGNTNGVFIPTSDLMLRTGKREKTAGRRWAAKQSQGRMWRLGCVCSRMDPSLEMRLGSGDGPRN